MTRDEAYSHLYSLIFRGFLVGDQEIGGSSFVFKTISDKEFNLIKACSGNPDGAGYLKRFNMQFLAHSVFALDGRNILQTRSQDIPLLVEFFSNIPSSTFKILMEDLNNLRGLCYDTLKYLEGFCYTSESRRLWKVSNGLSVNNESITGIPGTSMIGLNAHQETWVYLNKFLDNEERYNQELSLFLLVASATNPKGAKQTRNSHDSQVKSSEDRRKKLSEVGYIDTNKWSEEGWAAPVDTAEELVAELERQMKGMKDRHDLYIEEYMNKMKVAAEARAKAAEERMRPVVSDEPLLSVTQRPLSKEEIEKFIHNRMPKTTEVVKSDETLNSEESDMLLNKIGSKILTARK